MSTAGAPASFSLDTSRLWHQRAMHRSRSLVRTYLQSTSVPPRPHAYETRLRDVVQLPSLTADSAKHSRTTTTPLSISEPALYTLGERVPCEGFSCNRHPPVGKQPPPLPHCKSRDPSVGKSQSGCRPVYTHFSYPIKPHTKVVKTRSRSLALTTDKNELRPLVMQYRLASQSEALTVRGMPCLSLPSKPPTLMTARTQLHVFLPKEEAGEGEGDNESVDEGFMEELDNKITSLKIQQKAKIYAHPN